LKQKIKKQYLFIKGICLTGKILRFIFSIFGVNYASGSMTLVVDGTKSIRVETNFTPTEVWLNPLDRVGVPVCHADADWFAREIVPGGFVLLVKMNSNFRTVEWIAKG